MIELVDLFVGMCRAMPLNAELAIVLRVFDFQTATTGSSGAPTLALIAGPPAKDYDTRPLDAR